MVLCDDDYDFGELRNLHVASVALTVLMVTRDYNDSDGV